MITMNMFDGLILFWDQYDDDKLKEGLDMGRLIHPLGYSRNFLFAFDHDKDVYQKIVDYLYKIFRNFIDRDKGTIDSFVEKTEERYHLILELANFMEDSSLEHYAKLKKDVKMYNKGLSKVKDEAVKEIIKPQRDASKSKLRMYKKSIPKITKADKKITSAIVKHLIPDLKKLADEKKQEGLSLPEAIDDLLKLTGGYTSTGFKSDKLY